MFNWPVVRTQTTEACVKDSLNQQGCCCWMHELPVTPQMWDFDQTSCKFATRLKFGPAVGCVTKARKQTTAFGGSWTPGHAEACRLLGTKGTATRSKDATRNKGRSYLSFFSQIHTPPPLAVRQSTKKDRGVLHSTHWMDQDARKVHLLHVL